MIYEDVLPAVGPIVGAVLAGGLIGLEREWRGRAAGFRTHILVCLASALLMLAGIGQMQWAFVAIPGENIVTDPTRMAHGILTGIGFLCAGVIFRTGFSIHGLTTAASLWITSALGILFGAGLFALGALGTAVTVAILVGLRLVSKRLPARAVVDVEVCWRRGDGSPEQAVETLLAGIDPDLREDRYELIDDGRIVRRTWRLSLPVDHGLTTVSHRLCALEGVTGFSLDPRDD